MYIYIYNAVAERNAVMPSLKCGERGHESGRLRHRRRVRAAVPVLLCDSLCRPPAGHRRRSAGSGSAPCAARHSVTRSRPDRSRSRRRRAARPLRRRGRIWQRSAAASNCGGRRHWRQHWPAPTRRRFGPAPTRRTKGFRYCRSSPESSGAPSWMSALTAGRWPWRAAWCSAVALSLCNAKAGEGSVWPRGYPPTQPSYPVTALRPRGYPRFLFCFYRTAGG
jgi:hypothetical protein